jgi:two-component system chemotaxis response regulator CheB
MKSTEQKIIKVLIVEDSRVVMEFLTAVLQSDPQIRVVGTVGDGAGALEAVEATQPDVITMDIHMPKMNGFEATRLIMERCPKPIVIVSGSSAVDEVATSFQAVEAGALTLVARPNGIGHPQQETTAKHFLETVKLMADVKVVKRWPWFNRAQAPAPPPVSLRFQPTGPPLKIVAIGASTGGPLVLQTIFSKLPKDFPVPILVVQHMAKGFVRGFVEWLSNTTHFPVRVAVAGEVLLPGQAYVAPDDFQMGVEADRRIHLVRDHLENRICPSVSYLFRSIEQTFGASAIAVLLTGMGQDGAEELKRLKEVGAVTIAQDKESSVVHGMPGHAIQLDAAKLILSPDDIAQTLATLTTRL